MTLVSGRKPLVVVGRFETCFHCPLFTFQNMVKDGEKTKVCYYLKALKMSKCSGMYFQNLKGKQSSTHEWFRIQDDSSAAEENEKSIRFKIFNFFLDLLWSLKILKRMTKKRIPI